MNTRRLHSEDVQDKITNHKDWLTLPLYHSIGWTKTDTLINYKDREYILTGLAQPITRIKKCKLMDNIPDHCQIPSDTLILCLGEGNHSICCFIQYINPWMVCPPLTYDSSEDLSLYDKIVSLLKKDPTQELENADQKKILRLAQKSGLLFEPNQYQASIAIPLLSDDVVDGTIHFDVKKQAYQFISVLGWYFGGYVDIDESKDFYQKSPTSFGSKWVNVMNVMTDNTLYDFDSSSLPMINDDSTNMALAFWREGLKLRNIHSGYAFLSFYKVIESQFTKSDNEKKDRGIKKWIAQNLELIPTDVLAGQRIKYLLNQENNSYQKITTYLFQAKRCAIAHASSSERIINPDISLDREMLALDLPIIEALAERYIRVEKKVKWRYAQRCNQPGH